MKVIPGKVLVPAMVTGPTFPSTRRLPSATQSALLLMLRLYVTPSDPTTPNWSTVKALVPKSKIFDGL